MVHMDAVETAEPGAAGQSGGCTCRISLFVTVAAVAALTGLTPEYFYAGLREERFPGTRFGRSWRMPEPFVDAFLDHAGRTGLMVDFEDFARTWLEHHRQPDVTTALLDVAA